MKATELRIGNLLSWEDDKNRILKVSEIGFNKQNNRWVRFENGDGSIIEDESCQVIAIPLTEEWLVRFGFEGTVFLIGKGNFLYSPKNNVLTWFGVALHCSLWEQVHKFQNLWHSLTGEELTLQEEVKP